MFELYTICHAAFEQPAYNLRALAWHLASFKLWSAWAAIMRGRSGCPAIWMLKTRAHTKLAHSVKITAEYPTHADLSGMAAGDRRQATQQAQKRNTPIEFKLIVHNLVFNKQ